MNYILYEHLIRAFKVLKISYLYFVFKCPQCCQQQAPKMVIPFELGPCQALWWCARRHVIPLTQRLGLVTLKFYQKFRFKLNCPVVLKMLCFALFPFSV